ncbi:hypothetical protein JW859_07750 [bacterium]|nr:hypothetical protein [bacterium]
MIRQDGDRTVSFAGELDLRVRVDNENSADSVAHVIFCLKHDPEEDSPLTTSEALTYINTAPGSLPADIDVTWESWTVNPNMLFTYSDFKGSPFVKDERYWIAAVFQAPDGVERSPVSTPMRFRILPGYPTIEPIIGIDKIMTGVVSGCDGLPLEGAVVHYEHEGDYLEGRMTGTDGKYEFHVQVPNPTTTSAIHETSRGDVTGPTDYELVAESDDYTAISPLDPAYLDPAFTGYEVDFAFNVGPTADLESDPDPAEGEPPLYVSFDASGSSDPDHGVIVRYDWDWDGDGEYDLIDGDTVTDHMYMEEGEFDATVKVWDAAGAWDTASVEVDVSSVPASLTWVVQTVDSNGSSSIRPSIAELNGKPVISYWDYEVTHGNIWFAQADTATPSATADWDTHIIRSVSGLFYGSDSSMIINNGVPVVTATVDNGTGDGDLKYFIAGSSSPSSNSDWTEYFIDDSANQQGYYNSQTLIGTYPAVSYYNISDGNLKYACADTANPTSTSNWVHHTVDNSANVGQYSALVEINSLPAVAYLDISNNDVKYARATVSAPTTSTDWQIHTVASVASDTGLSLQVLNGVPVICYRDSYTLHYAAADTATPSTSSNWTSHSVDTTASTWTYMSMVDLYGRPAIAYHDGGTAKDLKFAWADSATPTSASNWDVAVVDSTGDVGRYANMTVINDRPYISYFDNTNYALKLARAE